MAIRGIIKGIKDKIRQKSKKMDVKVGDIWRYDDKKYEIIEFTVDEGIGGITYFDIETYEVKK